MEHRVGVPSRLRERIRAGAAAVEGERKQVTVLFCDLENSLALAERLDAEVWRVIMGRIFGAICDAVHRAEGIVDKFTGDGALALFGAPLAYEDHARRGCHAALSLTDSFGDLAAELRDDTGVELALRMGLNSGEVVVGSIGEDLDMSYTAVGHTVGLAKRMEELAEPGHIYVGESTARLATDFFVLRQLGRRRVRGVRDPVRVFVLLAPLWRRRARGPGTWISALVGRELELALLEDAFSRCEDGFGQVVAVVGEPGIGKTRLCEEFATRLRDRGVDVREGHAVPHARATPYLPVLELLRDYFGIVEEDRPEESRDKITRRVVPLVPDLEDDLPVMFEFLGVADPDAEPVRADPAGRIERILRAAERVMLRRSEREPAMILLEDLQWFDSASDAFAARLAEIVPNTRTLLVATHRPEYRAPWEEGASCQRLSLQPLTRASVAMLVEERLRAHPSLDGFVAWLFEGTAGNPFFCEEVLRALIEDGVLQGEEGNYELVGDPWGARVPDTVEAVVEARIDRLPEREKEVVQLAAVAGQTVSRTVLGTAAGLDERELGHSLKSLIAAEFLRREPRGTDLSFRHRFTRDVAYSTLLSERRTNDHRAVAAAIIESEPGRLDELAGTIASHFEIAREPFEAGTWYARAAGWALDRAAPAARDLGRRAARLLGEADPSQAAELRVGALVLALRASELAGIPPEEARGLFQEAVAAAKSTANAHAEALALMLYADIHIFGRGSMEEARRSHLQGLQLAQRVGDTGMHAVALIGCCISHHALGRLRDSLAFSEEGIKLVRDHPDSGAELLGYSPYVTHHYLHAMALTQMGHLEESGRELTRGLDLASQRGEPVATALMHDGFVSRAYFTGEGSGILEHADRAVELGERSGIELIRGIGGIDRGIAHFVREEWGEAATALRSWLEERPTGILPAYHPVCLVVLARAIARVENSGAAIAIAEEALGIARGAGMEFVCGLAQHALGESLRLAEGPRAAERIAAAHEAALASVERTEGGALLPLIRWEQAELAGAMGYEEERHRKLREALDLADASGATGYAERLRRAPEISGVL